MSNILCFIGGIIFLPICSLFFTKGPECNERQKATQSIALCKELVDRCDKYSQVKMAVSYIYKLWHRKHDE